MIQLEEVIYNILTENGVPMKLVKFININFNQTYSNAHVGEHLFDSFPTQKGLCISTRKTRWKWN
jgi:hypothetical protein